VTVLAGINGAVKTTASIEILLKVGLSETSVNADITARCLNAMKPERESAQGGRLMLKHRDELVVWVNPTQILARCGFDEFGRPLPGTAQE
jgi:predicted ABC-type ATPase